MEKTCRWRLDDPSGDGEFIYPTECNKVILFEDSYESNEYKFCPYCGGEIIEEKDSAP